MTETLWGVLIGGVIGLAGAGLAILSEYSRWRAEQRLTYLRERRAELEEMFADIRGTLAEDMKKDSYTNDMILRIVHRCPPPVWAAFDAMMRETERTPTNLIKHHFNVSEAMMKELAAIDGKLEKAVGA